MTALWIVLGVLAYLAIGLAFAVVGSWCDVLEDSGDSELLFLLWPVAFVIILIIAIIYVFDLIARIVEGK